MSCEKKLVAVGTTNRSKLLGVARAWRLFGPAELVAIDPGSPVSPQPLGWSEVVTGSLARARRALEKVSDASFGVGLEAGLVPAPVPTGYLEVQVAVIVDDQARVSVGTSAGFEIPHEMLGRVLGLEELGAVAERELRRRNIGERVGLIGYLTRGSMTRADLAFQATLSALIPRLRPDLYPALPTVGEYEAQLRENFF
ncbi:MAG: inosine/xanthosine triphosphatase [Fervidicoccaceae archaeon]